MRVWAEYAVWWLLLGYLYLRLITTPGGWELPIAAALATTGAAMAVLGRRAFSPATELPDFARRLVLLPVDVATDAARLTRLLVTGQAFLATCGRTGEGRLDDDRPAFRAWAVLLMSAAPGSLAVDSRTEDGHTVLLVHRLTPPGRVTADLER